MKLKSKVLAKKREKLKRRIRKKISGTPERPRLMVYRGIKNIIAQLNDDTVNTTIMSVNSSTVLKNLQELQKKTKCEVAKEVGKCIAEKALEKNIKEVVFDRSGYKYHGRIRALADGARESGLKF